MTSTVSLPSVNEETARRLDVAGPRYTSYPTVPTWSKQFGSEEYERALGRAGESSSPLSIYVHIPFCRSMCTYCGCNVVVARSSSVADRYLDDLSREIELASRALGGRHAASRVHWGGGTPTFLEENQLERLWRRLESSFATTADAEIAIEIDPVVTRRRQLDHLRALGFGRLSMGVQDFDPTVQAAVRRPQSARRTRELLDHARSLGFESVNFDLIYGLPHQDAETWRKTLDIVAQMRPDRIATYSFAYVPKVRPHQRKLDPDALPKGAAKLDLYRIARDRLVDAGYRPIGMDHFALPDDELARAQTERRLWRDFQGYTVQRAADTVAFGVTGISFVAGVFAQSHRSLSSYRAALQHGSFPTLRGLELTPDDRRRRAIITELMCNFWVDLGAHATDAFGPELKRLAGLEAEGLVRVQGREIEVTPRGRYFVRNVAMVFDAYLDRDAASKPTFSRTI